MIFDYSFIRRIAADKPCRLDALIFWARAGHHKVRFSQLKRIILEQQQAEAKKRKGEA